MLSASEYGVRPIRATGAARPQAGLLRYKMTSCRNPLTHKHLMTR
jgi:hypothetical protein